MNKLMPTVYAIALMGNCLITSAFELQAPAPSPPSQALALPPPTTAILPSLTNADFILEDEADYALAVEHDLIPSARLARIQQVNFNLNNSGTWEILANGSRVWRLRIESPAATDLYLVYDAWRIVKPCELYLYCDNYYTILGPYTSIDNGDGSNITPITKGEAVTLEYVVPEGIEDVGELSIMSVLHGYRHFFDRDARERDAIDAFGDAIECMVNVNCFPEYQEEKNSVGLIFNSWGYSCSGVLLNNTSQNGDPLFLTASHCLSNNPYPSLVYLNYESASCSPSVDGTAWHVIGYATLLMSDTLTQHALLRLSRPRPETAFIPSFSGWNRGATAPSNSFGIHHPRGDVKKAHQDFQPAVSSEWNGQAQDTHWWVRPDSGQAEPGSSGSPLFNESNRVVGTLHGGNWDCDVNTTNSLKYGKLAVAWEGDGQPSGRMRDWLDPTNTGATFMDAWQPSAPVNDSCGQLGVPLITSLPYSTAGSTLFSANNYNNSGCSTNNSPDVIFILQLLCDAQVTVSTCGSGFDTQLYIYQVGLCSDVISIVGCNDDFCGSQSQLSFEAQSGNRYLLVLEGYDNASGNYVLNVSGTSCGPVLDAPAGLTILPQLSTTNIVLRWVPVLGASSYSIYNSDTDLVPCNSPEFFLAETTEALYVHQGAISTSGQISYYCVTANP